MRWVFPDAMLCPDSLKRTLKCRESKPALLPRRRCFGTRVQVLSTALKRMYGVYLVSAGSESVGQLRTTGYGGESAFVLNRHAHWVTIRSIGGAYWDLNSMLDNPGEWVVCVYPFSLSLSHTHTPPSDNTNLPYGSTFLPT